MHNQLIDLDIYYENAQLKYNYNLLFEEYRKQKQQIKSCLKIIKGLKEHCIEQDKLLHSISKVIKNEQ